MAKLIPCPTCGNQCSENAGTCPKCGETLDDLTVSHALKIQAKIEALHQKKRRNKSLFNSAMLLFVVLVIGAMCSQFSSNRSKQETAAEKAQKENEQVEKKRKGFHFLSAWDGSHKTVVNLVKKNLRDPESFEHVETKISPVKNGEHVLFMKYRARNGFD
ncbi:MAG: hypothetical protein O2944_08175 [Proteobacteria bacterium]|nr:hypothetical protein [Pseudomonadota bacterium]